MAELRLEHIYKYYDQKEAAVDDFNLHIKDKEFIVFVGPSGCGKSTTLRMVAGLEDITKGDFYIGDTRVNDIAPKDRDIAMVFQNYALYPHMTVYDNIAFGLKLRKMPKPEIKNGSKKRRKCWGSQSICTANRRRSPEGAGAGCIRPGDCQGRQSVFNG